jgi:hypothetical protein
VMETVRPGVATEEQRAALREMLSRCDMPTRYRFPSIKLSRPTRKPLRGLWSSLRKILWPWKGRKEGK